MFSQTKPSVSGRIFLEHPTFFLYSHHI